MKALHIRLYTGDIRPYLRLERLKATAKGISWRGWVAWEEFPENVSSEPLKLAARTTLEDHQENTVWMISHPAALLKSALQSLVMWINKIGPGWSIRRR